MRLTDKGCMLDITGKNNEFFYIKDNQNITDDEIFNKLGQYEDIEECHNIETLEELDDLLWYVKRIKNIEEELGIYLPVFVRIIKMLSGIEDSTFYTKSEIDGEIDECSFVLPTLNLENQRLVEHYAVSGRPGDTYYYFKDYGITWALTVGEFFN